MRRDMTIQVVSMEEPKKPTKTVSAHSAPLLSVFIDPLNAYFMSTGCDGSACLWSLEHETDLILVKKWDDLFAASNDITTSPTLCRGCWGLSGEFVVLPIKNQAVAYSRDSWNASKTFSGKTSKVS